jgi:hypothetical protein
MHVPSITLHGNFSETGNCRGSTPSFHQRVEQIDIGDVEAIGYIKMSTIPRRFF